MSRKKNACIVCYSDETPLGYYCSGESACDFHPPGQCQHRKCSDLCRNTEAQNDALTRSAAAICDEQARRANVRGL